MVFDFFRTVIPPEVVCLEMSTIHVLALDYLVALYPLILIVITNISIELHATSGLLSGCGNLCNTASLVVVLEGSVTLNHLSLKLLP